MEEQYKPILYFHSKEKYFPCTIHDYIINCELMCGDEVLLPAIIHPNEIVEYNEDTKDLTKSDTLYSVKLREKEHLKYGAEWFVKNNNVNKVVFSQTPTFYVYFVYTYQGNDKITDIVYLLSYSYNGTLKSHRYDEEICVVRLKNDVPIKIGTSAHGGITWHPYYGRERPTLYVAKGSHAFYTNSENHSRIFYFGNDECDWGFRVENLDTTVIPTEGIDENHKYLYFIGARNYGESGHFTPKTRAYINTLDYTRNPHSMTLINNAIEGDYYILLYFFLVAPIGPIIYFNWSMVNNYNTPAWLSVVNILFNFWFFTWTGILYTVRTNVY